MLSKEIAIAAAIIAAVSAVLTPVLWLANLYGTLGGVGGIGIDIVVLSITIKIYNRVNAS